MRQKRSRIPCQQARKLAGWPSTSSRMKMTTIAATTT